MTSSPTPAATTPGPLSVAEYQQVLGRVEATVRRQVAGLMAAQTVTAANAGRTKVGLVLAQQKTVLEAVQPPPRLAAVHADALRTLSGFIGGTLENAVATGCTVLDPPAKFLYSIKLDVYQAISLGDDTIGKRTAFGRKLLPAPPVPPPDRRGVNGTVVQRLVRGGSGGVRVTNVGATDALVVVLSGKKVQGSVYVRARSKASLLGLRGAILISIRTGRDWDAAGRGFTADCEETAFTEPLASGYVWSFKVGEDG
ncbi:hypothetical protein AB0P21_25245 [Kribbella sp. NPDC056861]|uniref:hypothetical protein n=1 Tax=Kribbella sp. NPDC056861 TaxID=3154857 RepID=UPI003413C5C6